MHIPRLQQNVYVCNFSVRASFTAYGEQSRASLKQARRDLKGGGTIHAGAKKRRRMMVYDDDDAL